VEDGTTRTGAAAGFVEEEFDAAVGTGTTRDGSANVQSTLAIYKKEKGKEKDNIGALFGGSKLQAGYKRDA
jgi:hypothetical protein